MGKAGRVNYRRTHATLPSADAMSERSVTGMLDREHEGSGMGAGTSRGRHNFIGWLIAAAPWLAVALCSGLALQRALLVDQRVGGFTQCAGCFMMPTLGRDAWLLAAVAAFLGLAALSGNGGLRRILRLLPALILLAMAVDGALWAVLTQRFYLTDLYSTIGAMGSSWTVVAGDGAGGRAAWVQWLVATLIVAALVGLLGSPRQHDRRSAIFLLVIAVAWTALAAVNYRPLAYVNQDLIQNVVEINAFQGRQRRYSDEYARQAEVAVRQLPAICQQHPAKQPNVIVLLAESLSAWHSGLLGGPANWTPELDAIARDNHYLTHFYANGFTTSGGEIAVLLGVPPLYRPDDIYGAYVSKGIAGASLPDLAHRMGYQAQYFTNGDNDFLDVGDWMQSIGFDHVEDKDADFYRGLKRYEFGAPADEALFSRYLQWLDAREGNHPKFLSMLMTVTGHPPFLDPGSGRHDEERTVRYVDAQISRFERELRARHFFDDGILIVLGDHRSMTPLRVEELQAHGQRAFARIPLIVVGSVDMPAVVNEAFQQVDLLPSLAEMFGERRCRNPFQGSLLRADPQPARYVLHARGDDRNRVDVYSPPAQFASYRLQGDASHWLTDAPPDAAAIQAWITAIRTDASHGSGPPARH